MTAEPRHIPTMSFLRVSAPLWLLLVSVSCRREAKPLSRYWETMGTFASISVPATAEDALPDCFSQTSTIFADCDRLLSTYIDTSEVSSINRLAGGEPVAVSPATADMLALSRRYGDLSGGAFDISITPLMRLWGFREGSPPASLPASDDLEELLPLVDYRLIELGEGTARLPRKGMRIDLGGIAKGYAVDTAFDALAAAGHRDILVNLGGNMRGRGLAAPGRAWRVGVRNPFDRAQLVGAVALPDGWSVATSGNYEKFVEIDGQHYAHIMDPRSGLPVQGMAGVTVLSRLGIEADALSTALFVVGMDEAPALMDQTPDSEALLIPDRHPIEIHLTPGFAKHFTPLPAYRDAVRPINRTAK
ncbi:MAG: FAD:protein FMN transferase [Kiritimatiellae bacterium]|nr:FAD:protein FMN transferase [Kiritimatiellia bacterium]